MKKIIAFAVLCFMQLLVGFAQACWWLTVSLLPTSTPGSLSAGGCSPAAPNSYLCQVLVNARGSVQCVSLLNFMSLMIAQCTNLSRSFWKASCPMTESMEPPGLDSSSSSLMVHSTPASRSLTNMLNSWPWN